MKKIDAHMHVNGGGQDFGCPVDAVIDAADRLEIDQLVCSIPITGGRWATPAEVRECNDGLLEAMHRYPKRILSYCFLNPGYGREALQELERCVLGEGMVGIKLYNQYKINDPVLFPLIERTIELGVPILVHAARLVAAADIAAQPLTSHAGDFVDIGRRYPEAMIIHGHIAGGGDWQWTLKVLRDAPQSIYLDTSGSVMDNGLLERCVRDFGADRLLFGTDMTMEGNVARVRDAQITDAQREKIFFRNFKALLARRRAG
ncbi:MAG TPA: amidohydrolase family protein [Tepidisphaeraceae bacterium]|nr:amidohydrolase family protein [Tepidisphaeraceae bacterium]